MQEKLRACLGYRGRKVECQHSSGSDSALVIDSLAEIRTIIGYPGSKSSTNIHHEYFDKYNAMQILFVTAACIRLSEKFLSFHKMMVDEQ